MGLDGFVWSLKPQRRKVPAPGFDSLLLHVDNLISREVLINKGPRTGQYGKIVQQRGEELVVEFPDKARSIYQTKNVTIY